MENNNSPLRKRDIGRFLINKLTNSSINISPEIFAILLDSDDPNVDIDILIKEISFIPSFNNHLTLSELVKVPVNKLPRIFSEYLSQHKKIEDVIKKSEVRKIIYDLEENSEESDEFTENQNSSQVVADLESTISVQSNTSPESSQDTVIYQEDLFSDDAEGESKILEDRNSKLNETEISEVKVNHSISDKKRFNPLAKDYDFNYQILKDSTGQMHTSGGYDDFLELFRDKFNSFKKIMRRREDISAANNIANVLKINQAGDVKVLGLITDIRTTSSNNKIVELEDLSGKIRLLIKNSSENYELFKKTNSLVRDIMIFVQGYYKPGENKSPGIIFANELTELDVPVSYKPSRAEVPLSIALISDVHIGSTEFIPKLWTRFIKFLKGEIGSEKTRVQAGKIKYLVIGGDLVDGVGIYPNQKDRLTIKDIYKQFEKAAELLSEVPSYIKIFYLPGSHEPVRRALPQPAVPKKYINDLLDLGTVCVSDPVLIQTEGVKTLSFHGDSLIDLNMSIPGLSHERPVKSMKELLKYRHLAPSYGGKTQIAPIKKDWLIIDTVPDIFHTGHIHINGHGKYRNVLLANSGCFQSQTDYMRAFGITPTPGIIEIVELDTLNITGFNLNS